jgi:predicted amidohydrolase YtcJ
VTAPRLRRFLAPLALPFLAGVIPLVARPAPAAAVEADVVLRGGVVYTADAQRTRVEAVAVDGGRIVAVGTGAQMAPLVGADTEVVELAGGMVLPGFHDSHAHPIAGGMDALACSLIEERSIDAILAKVRACAGANAGAGEEWLVGAGWDLSLFPAANPHRSQLDAVVGDRPVVLHGADGHSIWVNSKALARAGIDRGTEDPPHGKIERDPATGEPSGTLRESAKDLVTSLVPPPSMEARRLGLRHASRLAASFGITSIVDAGASPEDLRAYADADTAGDSTFRVRGCWPGTAERRHGETLSSSRVDPREGSLSARVRTGCVKIFVDGVLEGETAALLEPYLGRGGGRGQLHIDSADLAPAVTRLDAAGVQIHLHTIGDRAVRVALDAIEAARRANGPRDHRHHLAHLQLVHPDDVPRFAALGVTATFQALWAYPDTYIENINLAQVGPERVARMYPIGSIRRAGGRIAAGSDWPVTSMNPLLAIEVALTRQDPAGGDPDTLNAGERVDLETMLDAFTIHGAWLMRQEETTGSIEVGKAADLVVLERDLFAIPPGEIGEVRVVRTILEGETVYVAP